MTCKTHPDAPHGFLRSASHGEGRYVCECEFWEPDCDKCGGTLVVGDGTPEYPLQGCPNCSYYNRPQTDLKEKNS